MEGVRFFSSLCLIDLTEVILHLYFVFLVWSAPSAIGIAGLGGGFEIGAEVIFNKTHLHGCTNFDYSLKSAFGSGHGFCDYSAQQNGIRCLFKRWKPHFGRQLDSCRRYVVRN